MYGHYCMCALFGPPMVCRMQDILPSAVRHYEIKAAVPRKLNWVHF